MGIEAEYKAMPQHLANGMIVTAPSSFAGNIEVSSRLSVKQMAVNSTLAGTVTINSGSTIATVSLTNVKSDSLVFLQLATKITGTIFYDVTSQVDGVSFAAHGSSATNKDVKLNYLIFEV